MDAIYLFVDGGYAREVHKKAMERVFGFTGELDFDGIKRSMNPFRMFIYDCLDDLQRDRETQDAFRERVRSQEEQFAKIRALRGVHLQLGTIAGKRRRQKEVDVLLVVDMLTHAFNKNMSHAVLLAGDLDFRPLVEAVVRAGVFIEVCFEKSSTAKELRWAADFGLELNWHAIYNWNTDEFRKQNLAPRNIGPGMKPRTGDQVRVGSLVDGSPIDILKTPDHSPYVAWILRDTGEKIAFEHSDQGVLERYAELEHGPISWK